MGEQRLYFYLIVGTVAVAVSLRLFFLYLFFLHGIEGENRFHLLFHLEYVC